MSAIAVDRLTAEARASPVLARLDRMARELAGATLVVYLRSGSRVLELYPAGPPDAFPDFCGVIRETLEGRRRCATCRSLVTFGACYRGLLEYQCHGGVSVVAAPALRPDGTPSATVAVAACAFAQADRRSGWAAARDDSRELGVDLVKLRNAYRRLPRMTPERLRFAKSIVEVTAAAVGEIRRAAGDHGATRNQAAADPGSGTLLDVLERELGQVLYLARDRGKEARGSRGETLVEHVKLMVGRDPALPYSVSRIARAARISPNHLSTVFARHAGQTFVHFVRDERLKLAERLLRDLSLTVAEVAERSGFSDAGYFTRCFKAHAGMTPTRWRRALRP